MKLLYVSHVDTVVRMMLPHLDGARAAGFTVDVACNITRHGEDVLAHSDTLWDLPFRRSPLHPANGVALSKLTDLLKREQYDIVHAHTPSGGVLGRLAATRARRADDLPLRVYTPHGFHFHRYGSRLSNTIFRTIETHAGRNWSDAILTINREDFNAARDGVAAPARVYHTRGVGVSAEVLAPDMVSEQERERMRCEVGAKPETLVVTLIGEMIPRKRHTDALNAFARFRKSHPNSLLLFAGDGPLMDKLKEQAQELGIVDAVRFLGFRRDIPALLSATDLFLFPSAQEGLPCSVQEALCMEIPVVASDVRGNHDLLDDSCGRLVPLGDVDAFAAALSHFAALSPEERRESGRAGRRKMITEYDRPVAVAQWLDIYRELLTSRGLKFPEAPSTPPKPGCRLVKL